MFSQFNIVKSKINSLIDNKTDLLIKSELSKTEDVLFEEYLLKKISSVITFVLMISYFIQLYLKLPTLHLSATFIILVFLMDIIYADSENLKKKPITRLLLKFNSRNNIIYDSLKKNFAKAKKPSKTYSRTKADRLIRIYYSTYYIFTLILVIITFKLFISYLQDMNFIMLIDLLLIFSYLIFFANAAHKQVVKKIIA